MIAFIEELQPFESQVSSAQNLIGRAALNPLDFRSPTVHVAYGM